MPKPNYAYEKRQRELEKKRKKEDKAQKKATPAPQGEGSPRSAQEADDTTGATNATAPN